MSFIEPLDPTAPPDDDGTTGRGIAPDVKLPPRSAFVSKTDLEKYGKDILGGTVSDSGDAATRQ